MAKGFPHLSPQTVDQNTVPAETKALSQIFICESETSLYYMFILPIFQIYDLSYTTIQAKLILVRDKHLHGNSTSHKVGRLARK